MQKMKNLSFILALLIIILIGIRVLAPQPPLLNNLNFSQAIYDKQHHLLRLTLTADDKYRLYTPLKDISPLMLQATLLQEDQYFYWHPGINPFAIIKAAWQTYILHTRQIGASTITMQVARMRFNINSKTIAGKIVQILRALQLELFYSKSQILEAYLNLAAYGGNVEGVGAASIIYFNKPAKQLNLVQALTLSVIPQNPARRVPAPKNQQDLKNARNKLFLRWLKQNPQDKDKQALMQLPMQLTKNNLPFLAPHLVDTVIQQNPQQASIITTLDLTLQKIIEQTVQKYIIYQQPLGVNNVAVMLVDTRDMEVKALLGSANFFDKAINGQVNGTTAKRSPGSTLKPFIYALAIDQGLIHPNTVLKDAPSSFGAYNPENFDNDFMGPIKAKDALVLSRNIPAVYLAEQLKNPTLYQFLQQANVNLPKAEKDYGLSLVLGGAEVTMEELVSLYAILANHGIWQPLRMQVNQSKQAGKRLLSPEASFLTLDMLKNTPRPTPVNAAINQPIPVYWKTGTSSGYRDAWSIGVFGHYVLAVWVGDFSGKSNPSFIGTQSAAPLFFAIIEAITRQVKELPVLNYDVKKLNLTQVKVCDASGLLATRYCPNVVTTWFIPGKSPIKKDDIYREVAIDKTTQKRACHFDQNTEFKVYEFWPSDLLKIFAQAGVQRQLPPAYGPACSALQNANAGIAPKIISPQQSLIYAARLNRPTTILFYASSAGDVRQLYWFVNNSFIGSANSTQTSSWLAKPGHYIIRVVDDHGRATAQDLIVQATN
jgi:penicillin-binding protein 1C